MTQAAVVINYITDFFFVLVGLRLVVDYALHRERSQGYLAMAVGLLGIVAILTIVDNVTNHSLGELMLDGMVLTFLGSGYALVLFRSSFIPLKKSHLILVSILVAFTGLYLIAARLPINDTVSLTWWQSLGIFLFIAVWVGCAGEPAIRFLLASRHQPAVQASRLRSLSIGFMAIITLLVISAFGNNTSKIPFLELITAGIGLVSAPLIYISFAPPGWLRREWRNNEEHAYQEAIRDLLLFSPNRMVLAEKALEWAPRLVGAPAAMIADSDGKILAGKGMDLLQARYLYEIGKNLEKGKIVPLGNGLAAIIVPLFLGGGTGVIAVISGPFTPFFGSDEIKRLWDYSINVTAGLDRVGWTERMDALEKTKSNLLNLASHELRGPITVMRGYLSMLEGGSLGPISPQAHEIMPVLLAKADEMNSLVAQMIEAARLESGKLELLVKEADLRELVLHSVEATKPMATPKHEIEVVTGEKKIKVNVDPDRITTVVNNLLSNALKYSPDGGKIVCRVDHSQNKALVSISDQGMGISKENMDQLFTRFGRIVNNKNSDISGTGLGLYLSREIARMHGGDITVTSMEGKGSTFVLEVPIESAENN